MAIITKSELISEGRNRTAYIGSLSAVIREARTYSTKSQAAVTVFLSHSHRDADIVEEAVAILRTHGVIVYVDWQDDTMPEHTCAETAHRIKEKIRENKKFVLLATNTAIASKWCNWEIGYGDTHKYIDHMALLPVADTAGNWQGNEYLQLYPTIQKYGDTFYVSYPGKATKSLKEWLLS